MTAISRQIESADGRIYLKLAARVALREAVECGADGSTYRGDIVFAQRRLGRRIACHADGCVVTRSVRALHDT